MCKNEDYEIEVEYSITYGGGFQVCIVCVKAPKGHTTSLWGYKSRLQVNSSNNSWDIIEDKINTRIEEAKAEISRRRSEIPTKKIIVL